MRNAKTRRIYLFNFRCKSWVRHSINTLKSIVCGITFSTNIVWTWRTKLTTQESSTISLRKSTVRTSVGSLITGRRIWVEKSRCLLKSWRKILKRWSKYLRNWLKKENNRLKRYQEESEWLLRGMSNSRRSDKGKYRGTTNPKHENNLIIYNHWLLIRLNL